MSGKVAHLITARPRLVLVCSLIAALLLGALAALVPGSLQSGSITVAGTESERAAEFLEDELGYEAEPSLQVVLVAQPGVPAGAIDVATETVRRQAELVEGVGAAEIGSSTGRTRTIEVHLDAATEGDSEATKQVLANLGDVDPGALQLSVGGRAALEQAALDLALDDAPGLIALALPIILLVLFASVGLRLAAVVALGAALTVSATLCLLGLLDQLTPIAVPAAPVGAILALVLAVESAAICIFRYREESATLGGGAEALEYSLHTVLKGAAIGAFTVALLGLALLAVPAPSVRSIAAAVVFAGLLGPTLVLIPVAAGLSSRALDEVGEPLPLVADDKPPDGGPLAFRLLFRLGRSRVRGALFLLPLGAAVVLAFPVFDAESVGLGHGELPPELEAVQAAETLAENGGEGATEPLLVVSEGGPEAPTEVIYRDEISQLDSVAEVGFSRPVGEGSVFDVALRFEPRSLEGQAGAELVRGVDQPQPADIGGGAAAQLDAGARLGDDLPLVALIAILGTAAFWSYLFRSPFGLLLALCAAIAPVAGVGAVAFVFEEGRFPELLDYSPLGAAHLTSFAIVAAVLISVGAARGAQLATALREERVLGGGAAGSLARSGLLTLMPAAIATVVGAAAAFAWIGSDLVGAKEVAIGIGFGLLADLILVRALLAPALARLSL